MLWKPNFRRKIAEVPLKPQLFRLRIPLYPFSDLALDFAPYLLRLNIFGSLEQVRNPPFFFVNPHRPFSFLSHVTTDTVVPIQKFSLSHPQIWDKKSSLICSRLAAMCLSACGAEPHRSEMITGAGTRHLAVFSECPILMSQSNFSAAASSLRGLIAIW